MLSLIFYRAKIFSEVQTEECLDVDALTAMIMNFESDGIEKYGSLVPELDRGDFDSNQINWSLGR